MFQVRICMSSLPEWAKEKFPIEWVELTERVQLGVSVADSYIYPHVHIGQCPSCARCVIKNKRVYARMTHFYRKVRSKPSARARRWILTFCSFVRKLCFLETGNMFESRISCNKNRFNSWKQTKSSMHDTFFLSFLLFYWWCVISLKKIVNRISTFECIFWWLSSVFSVLELIETTFLVIEKLSFSFSAATAGLKKYFDGHCNWNGITASRTARN